MSSKWLKNDYNLKGKLKRLFGVEFHSEFSRDTSVWLQFVPGVVRKVFHHQTQTIDGNLGPPYFIRAKSDLDKEPKRYVPLLSTFVDPPSPGDRVLLCTFDGIDYYLGPIDNYKLGMMPQQKIDALDIEEDETPFISGDITIGNKFGNSVRLGSRRKNPVMIFSNNRVHETESYLDGSTIIMSSQGNLLDHLLNNDTVLQTLREEQAKLEEEPIPVKKITTFSSDHYLDDNEKSKFFPIKEGVAVFFPSEAVQEKAHEYTSDQILLTSGRITIDSSADSLFLSSNENIHIGAKQNITVFANNEIVLNSTKTYLGKAAKEAEIADRQGLIIGENLRALMEELIDILMEVTGNQSGVAVPLLMNSLVATTELSPFTSRLSNIKTALGKNVNNFVSDKHFIEENEY